MFFINNMMIEVLVLLTVTVIIKIMIKKPHDSGNGSKSPKSILKIAINRLLY